MQKKHYFFFLFGNPNVRGGGVKPVGQIPNFYRKFVLEASLTQVDRAQASGEVVESEIREDRLFSIRLG